MTSPQHVCCTSRGFGADIENEAQQAPPLLEALMEQVARRANKNKDKRPQLSAVLGVLGNCKWRREIHPPVQPAMQQPASSFVTRLRPVLTASEACTYPKKKQNRKARHSRLSQF